MKNKMSREVPGKQKGRGDAPHHQIKFTTLLFSGEFEQGELCGTGQMKYSDGRRYTGQWSENKYEGKGTLHSGEGDIYTGHFHLHKRHGDGEQVVYSCSV